jgi:hypothetical protein
MSVNTAKTFHLSQKYSLEIPFASQASSNSSWVAPFADGGFSGVATFFLTVGAITQNVTFKLTQAQDSSGTGAKDITGAVLATAFTSSTDNATRSIAVQPGALDDANGFKYIRAEVTVSGGASEIYGVQLVLGDLRYNPPFWTQDATYTAQVTVNDQS